MTASDADQTEYRPDDGRNDMFPQLYGESVAGYTSLEFNEIIPTADDAVR